MHIKSYWHSLNYTIYPYVARAFISFCKGVTLFRWQTRFNQWGHRDLNSGLRTPSPQGYPGYPMAPSYWVCSNPILLLFNATCFRLLSVTATALLFTKLSGFVKLCRSWARRQQHLRCKKANSQNPYATVAWYFALACWAKIHLARSSFWALASVYPHSIDLIA